MENIKKEELEKLVGIDKVNIFLWYCWWNNKILWYGTNME